MARNIYFSDKVTSEQQLYENIVIESLKMYGQDVYYLPRDIVNEDRIFGDDVPSRFNSSYKVEMYIENTDGFDGDGDLFTKFGVEIRDQATFVIARKRWADTVQRYDNDITIARPAEGDLIYLPMTKSMFQIMHVEHEQPFYQLSNLPVYKLRAELFEYNDEDLDTGIDAIDDIERNYAYAYNLTFSQSGATAAAVKSNQTLTNVTILNGGTGYTSAPTVTFTNLPQTSSQIKFGTNSLYPATEDNFTLNSVNGQYSTESHRGSIQFWIYFNTLPDAGVYYKIYETGATTSSEGINYRSAIIVNSNGALCLASYDDYSIEILENITTSYRLTTGTWHYIKISLRGTESGLSDRLLQVYHNGTRVHSSTSNDYGGAFRGGYVIGGEEYTIPHSVANIGKLNGYIDDFLADIGQPGTDATIAVPSTQFTGVEPNAVAYESFNTVTPTATATVSNGVVTGVTVNTTHDYFKRVPTVTLSAPPTLDYIKGEIVQQTLTSGVVISGEVAEWKVSTGEMKVIHVGASDGVFHNFITTQNVVGLQSEISVPPNSVTEENQISANEQNDDFEEIADGFLDFTETNPFGDPNES